MKLSNLQLFWRNAAAIRGLSVTMPFSVTLEDGEEVYAEVLLHGYGARSGMLILQSSEVVMRRSEAIISSGYGYSCMSSPTADEIFSTDGLDDLLEDWGVVADTAAQAEQAI